MHHVKTVTISTVNWIDSLTKALKGSDVFDTVIIVQTKAQKELAERAAYRMGKSVTIRIADATP